MKPRPLSKKDQQLIDDLWEVNTPLHDDPWVAKLAARCIRRLSRLIRINRLLRQQRRRLTNQLGNL